MRDYGSSGVLQCRVWPAQPVEPFVLEEYSEISYWQEKLGIWMGLIWVGNGYLVKVTRALGNIFTEITRSTSRTSRNSFGGEYLGRFTSRTFTEDFREV